MPKNALQTNLVMLMEVPSVTYTRIRLNIFGATAKLDPSSNPLQCNSYPDSDKIAIKFGGGTFVKLLED